MVSAPAAIAEPGDQPVMPLYQLIDTAAERLQAADPVAASKWINGGPITDTARVHQVLAAVGAEAESDGVPVDYVRTLFTDQINATEAIQYSRFAWWKLNPAAAPATAPDLSTSRTGIDALNHRMVAEIAAQLPVLRSADCSIELDAAKAAVNGARALDPLYRQALDAATRSYCRP
ncbi:chorismate mutase [Mycolicibacterium sp.]|uniref:chorismate mutase n=1 Tax=Mycolicibacterium sp. TaxID=2320850 RepID=UPI0025E90D3C|nr:chorismate mutase [Mycolicibacterium sp.]